MGDAVVVGLDGGGTNTRVAVADREGDVLRTAKRGGASTQHNNPLAARRHLREGIQAIAAEAEVSLSAVIAMTAGIGGLNGPVDYAEAERFVDIDGLPWPQTS